jgi:predicted nucleic acid-binding protein
MSIVVDANLIVSLVIPLPYSGRAAQLFKEWKRSNVELFAPLLLEYEMTSALRKAVVSGILKTEEAHKALEQVSRLGIVFVPASAALHARALWWAEQIRQPAAYDAQYLALAEQQGAEFWTADRRLAETSKSMGVTMVHWIGGNDE